MSGDPAAERKAQLRASAVSARTAACSCGQLRLTVNSDPVRISICHCLECQKRTGSVFGVQARFRRADVVVAGDSTRWARRGAATAGAWRRSISARRAARRSIGSWTAHPK